MEVAFADDALDRLETEDTVEGRYTPRVVAGYRQLLQLLRAVFDESDLFALKGVKVQKLKGDEYMLILDECHLLLDLKERNQGATLVVIKAIEKI